jgi:hypothetical protein
MQGLDLLLPEPLHLVVHPDRGELVHGDDEALAQIAATREVLTMSCAMVSSRSGRLITSSSVAKRFSSLACWASSRFSSSRIS